MARPNAPSPHRSAHISADRKRHAQDLDWGRWQSGIRHSRGSLRFAADACHHWRRSKSLVDLYHRAFAQFGRPVREIGVHSHGYVAETDDQAREELWPDYKTMRDRIGAERGWPPMTRTQFDSEIEHGSLYVGAPETVAHRIATTAKALGISRFHMKYSAGTLSHEKVMHCIKLYGRRVIPLTRDMLA